MTNVSFWSCYQHTHTHTKRKSLWHQSSNRAIKLCSYFLIVLAHFSWNRSRIFGKTYQTILITLRHSFLLRQSCLYPVSLYVEYHRNMAHKVDYSVVMFCHSFLLLKATTSDSLLSKFIRVHFRLNLGLASSTPLERPFWDLLTALLFEANCEFVRSPVILVQVRTWNLCPAGDWHNKLKYHRH